MTPEEFIRKLDIPAGPIDVVLDTDAYNEIDDQYAIAYLLRAKEKCRVKAIFAAPFSHPDKNIAPDEGMELSYREIFKIIKLSGDEWIIPYVYRGAVDYLPNEMTACDSPAVQALLSLSQEYTADHPLYVAAIGAITNIASALILDPSLKDRIVLVWLGGHSHESPNTAEYNMVQDIAAARVVFGSGVPLVQLPCGRVVEQFRLSRPELEAWFLDKNPLCDYLASNTIREAESYAAGKPWSRTIWDVTAIAWLLNDGERFMSSKLIHAPIPTYDQKYTFDDTRHIMRYVTWINRDALMEDMIHRLTAS